MQLRDPIAGFIRTEGGLVPPDLLERIRALDSQLPFLDTASYGLERGDRFGETITRSWNRLVGAWATFSDEASFEELFGSAGPSGRWRPEEGGAPEDLVVGLHVRHRSHGEGLVLSVRREAHATSLLIRFPSDEKEIGFGYGVLADKIVRAGRH